MAETLDVRDITAAAINTVRGGNVDSWELTFTDPAASRYYGDIYDNANSFVHGTAEGSDLALMIQVRGDTETVAIQDMDFITVTYVDGSGSTASFVIWLPALSGDDDLYVDTDGNTWYDAALTLPAGGVKTFAESLSLAEYFFKATDWFTDTISISDSIASVMNWRKNFSESIRAIDTLTDSLKIMTNYFTDRINLTDGFSGDRAGDFTEDSQTDYSWVEV